MAMDDYSDPFLIDSLRSFRGLSLRELAKLAGLDASSLSYWLRGIESRVSKERLKPAKALLGLGEDGLLPGVHRWIVPSQSHEEIERVEKTVFRLLPGGGTVVQVRRSGCPNTNELSESPFLSWIAWVLIPDLYPDVRVIIRIGEKIPKTMKVCSIRDFNPANFAPEWKWRDLSDDPETDNEKNWVTLSARRYKDLTNNTDLKVEEVDKFLSGFSGILPEWDGVSFAADPGIDYGWTWDLILGKLKEAGLKPAEVAKKLGLSQ
ncbi:MAG: helix-turn-helix domain-containing protein [Leptospirales bacterium]